VPPTRFDRCLNHPHSSLCHTSRRRTRYYSSLDHRRQLPWLATPTHCVITIYSGQTVSMHIGFSPIELCDCPSQTSSCLSFSTFQMHPSLAAVPSQLPRHSPRSL
ncbi:unnamed protein product, partial [Ectocarpus sp. 6 AP-2014]